jgi:hypothetical protein
MQLDGLEVLYEARRARQALEAVIELQPNNCLGWHGYLLRG